MPSEGPSPSRLMPVLVLAGMLAAGLVAWWGFPAAQTWFAQRDCVASGHTNCG